MPPQVVRPRVTTKFLGSARTLKGIDDKRRVLRHRISAQIVDRDGDVVVSSGGQVKAFLEHNPVVFLNHAARELPIARSLDVITGRTEVEAETQFAGLDQMHPTAETVYRLYRDGFMHSWSMGFIADPAHVSREAMFPGQRGRTIKQWELLEYSAVGIPANPQAKSAMVQSLIAKGLLTLPDGATDEDLGKALGTIPLAKYWQATNMLSPSQQGGVEDMEMTDKEFEGMFKGALAPLIDRTNEQGQAIAPPQATGARATGDQSDVPVPFGRAMQTRGRGVAPGILRGGRGEAPLQSERRDPLTDRAEERTRA